MPASTPLHERVVRWLIVVGGAATVVAHGGHVVLATIGHGPVH